MSFVLYVDSYYSIDIPFDFPNLSLHMSEIGLMILQGILFFLNLCLTCGLRDQFEFPAALLWQRLVCVTASLFKFVEIFSTCFLS